MKRAALKSRTTALSRPRLSRVQLLVIAGVVLLCAALGGYIWYSVHYWSGLNQRTTQTSAEIKSSVQDLQQHKYSLAQVRQKSRDIAERAQSMCDTTPLAGWQASVISGARDTQATCKTYQQRLGAANTALAAIVARVESEKLLAAKLTALQTDLSKLQPADYEAQRAAWVKFRTDLDKQQVHATLQATEKSALATSQELIGAYDALLAADKQQKRAEFDAASADIQKGFSKLGELQNLSVDSYAKLLDSLKQKSQSL